MVWSLSTTSSDATAPTYRSQVSGKLGEQWGSWLCYPPHSGMLFPAKFPTSSSVIPLLHHWRPFLFSQTLKFYLNLAFIQWHKALLLYFPLLFTYAHNFDMLYWLSATLTKLEYMFLKYIYFTQFSYAKRGLSAPFLLVTSLLPIAFIPTLSGRLKVRTSKGRLKVRTIERVIMFHQMFPSSHAQYSL